MAEIPCSDLSKAEEILGRADPLLPTYPGEEQAG